MITFSPTSAFLVSIVCSSILAQFIDEIPAPDLAGGRNSFHPWLTPGPPYPSSLLSQGKNPDLVNYHPDNTPQTLQQKIRRERKISSSVFLQGLSSGSKIARPGREATVNNTSVEREISPVSVTVSDYAPPTQIKAGEEKCKYVQLMNTTMEEECTKGGMRCERKCTPKIEEPVCTEKLIVSKDFVLFSVIFLARMSVRMCQKRYVKL